MSLKLSKTNIAPYNYYSESTGLNPVTADVTLDNSGGIKGSTVVAAFIVATTFNYTNITISPVTEQAGINWRVSLDNITWFESVTPSDMDATITDQAVPIYFAAVVNNDGTIITGNYIQCKVRITATENP